MSNLSERGVYLFLCESLFVRGTNTNHLSSLPRLPNCSLETSMAQTFVLVVEKDGPKCVYKAASSPGFEEFIGVRSVTSFGIVVFK